MKKCKRLLSTLLAVMMLLGCVQAAFIVGAESASTIKVATISDIRYQAGTADKEGLMLSKSAALLDAAIAKVKASDADVLLVTGDLTNNGSKTSHQYVASKLAEVKAEGIPVYVIPGEHDVREGGTTTAVSKAVFEDLYKDFGYGEAQQDPSSASYVADLGNGFKVVMSDSVAADGQGQMPQWVVDKAKAEVANGNTVFAASHHPAVTRSSVDRTFIDLLHTLASIDLNLLDGAIRLRPYTENPDVAAAQLGLVDRTCILSANGADPSALADAGVKFLFTGHGGSLSISGTTTTNGAQMYDVMSGSLVNASASVRYTTLSKATAGMKEQRAQFQTEMIASAEGVANVTQASHDALAKQMPAEVDYAIEKAEALLGRILPQIHTYLNSFIDNLDVPALLDKVGGIADALMTIIKGPIGKDVIKAIKADVKSKIVNPLFSYLSVSNLHSILADARSALEQTDYNGNEFYSFLADIFTTIQKGDGKTPTSVQAIFDSLKAENPDVMNGIIRSFGSHFNSTRTVALINNLLNLGLSGSYAAGIVKINFTVRQLLVGPTTILTPGDVTLDLWSADMLGGMYAANGQTVAEVVKPIINALLLGQDNANVAQTTQRFDAALQNPDVITHALFAFNIGSVLGDSIFAQGQSGAYVARTVTLAELGDYLNQLVPNNDVSSLNAADWAKVRDALNAAGRFTAEQLATVNKEFVAGTDSTPAVNQLSKLEELANAEFYKAVAADFTAKVNALPAVDALTLGNAQQVYALQAEYDQFYAGIKANLSAETVAKLNAAVAKIAALENYDAAVDAVMTKIAAIGTVTTESEAAIQDARAAYDALTIRQQKQVTNYQVLVDAEAALILAKENAAIIKSVMDKIDAIGEVSYTPASKAKIDAARLAYNSLAAELQASVGNYDVLAAAEARYAELKAAEEDAAAAAPVIKQIDAIGKVTLESKRLIEAAEAAFAALTDSQKALVTNYETLAAARAAYDALVKEQADNQAAAQAVMDQIAAIGTVTLESEAAIQQARAAYDALTAAQKALVENLTVLTNAESTLAALQKQAADEKAAKAVDELIAAIGDVTLEKEEQIAAARDAYNALTSDQKRLVENLAVLTAAEAQLSVLKNDFLFEDGATGITLRADSGVLPLDTIMTVREVVSGSAFDAILAKNYKAFRLYDISLASGGSPVAPTKAVKISIPQFAANTAVYSVAADGTMTPVEAVLENGSFNFSAEQTGMFAVAQAKVSVDTTALQAAIAAFEALDAAHYNAASFAKANAAYEAAKAELNANYELTSANQRKVDAAAAALNNAMALLTYLPADISGLNTVLYQAKMMKAADYVDFSDVEEAIAAADEFLAGSYDIRNQAAINALAQNLSAAIAALILAPADFTAIDNAIAVVPKDLHNYTEASVAALNAAVNAAKEAKNTITRADANWQAQVQAYAQDVLDAIAGLQKADVAYADTSLLELAIDMVHLYYPADYVDFSGVEAAVAAAQNLLNGKPTADRQDEVDAAAMAIFDAIGALEWA